VAMVELRKRQYNRIKALAESQSIEQELVDEKLQARKAAEANERSTRQAVTTAEAGVAAAESRVKRSEADVEDARAQVGVAQAQLTQAQAFEEYTRLRAPFDGVVTQRNYHEGDFIRDAASGGAGKPVLSVARTDKMRVITWVPDPDVPYTHRGEPATLRVDSLGGRELKGVVARTADSEDYQSRTMRTEMDLENPDGTLTDGMYGRMTIDLGKTKQGLTVPSSCLSAEGKNNERVAYVVRDGKAQRVTVQVGLDDGIRAEALAGLKPDDEVISQHGPGLADGVAVQVVRPEH
jgi:HlyD family secretion protein